MRDRLHHDIRVHQPEHTHLAADEWPQQLHLRASLVSAVVEYVPGQRVGFCGAQEDVVFFQHAVHALILELAPECKLRCSQKRTCCASWVRNRCLNADDRGWVETTAYLRPAYVGPWL